MSLLMCIGCKLSKHAFLFLETFSLRVCENNVYKLLWDFAIVTDTLLQHNRPDITMLLKETNEVYSIDIVIPGNSRFSQKAVEKQTKYLDFKY